MAADSPMTGPVPKRSEERRRRNKDGMEVEKVDVSKLIAEDVEIPVADENWHEIAKLWYNSLKSSGQAVYYEPSDWAMAYVVAETIHREMMPKEIKVGQQGDEAGSYTIIFEEKIMPVNLSVILKGATDLMATEAHRRRLRLEIDRAAHKQQGSGSNPAGVTNIATKRQDRFKREA